MQVSSPGSFAQMVPPGSWTQVSSPGSLAQVCPPGPPQRSPFADAAAAAAAHVPVHVHSQGVHSHAQRLQFADAFPGSSMGPQLVAVAPSLVQPAIESPCSSATLCASAAAAAVPPHVLPVHQASHAHAPPQHQPPYAPPPRLRSGQPPAAPPLDISFARAMNEPLLFRQWERKVASWRLRATQWLPEPELALVLVEALSGDAAVLTQDIALGDLYCPGGVDILLDHLAPLRQPRVTNYQQSMKTYESLRRRAGETTKSFHARFLSAEHQLARLGLQCYSGESRGIKWLAAMDLPPQEQRQVLTSAGGYDLEKLKQATELQYGGLPPPVRSQPPPKPGGNRPPHAGTGAARRPHAAHVAEELGEEAAAAVAETPEGDPLDAVVEALSVTTQKLKAYTLSRGFVPPQSKGKGKDGKGKSKGKEAKGDKGKGTSSSSSSPSTSTSSSSQSGLAQRVSAAATQVATRPRQALATAWEQFVLDYAEEADPVAEENYEEWDYNEYQQNDETADHWDACVLQHCSPHSPPLCQSLAWDINFVQREHDHWAITLVLDTACQRSVCSQQMLDQLPLAFLQQQGEHETFRFGMGTCVSQTRSSVGLRIHRDVVAEPDFNLSFSTAKTSIPFLLSRGALETLGADISLATHSVTLTRLPDQPVIPLVSAAGHLGVKLWVSAPSTPPQPSQDVVIVAEAVLSTDDEADGGTQPDEVHDSCLTTRRDDLPMMRPAEHLDPHAESVLLDATLPRCRSRTNLKQHSEHPTCGIIFGGYTRRGVGVTMASTKRSPLLQAALRVAASRPKNMQSPFLSIALTRGPVSRHRDMNAGVSCTMALGQYRGGALVVNQQPFYNHRSWVMFDAAEEHYVADYTGSRTSISLFTPRFPGLLRNHLPMLRSLGFPTARWLQQPGWLQMKGDRLLPSDHPHGIPTVGARQFLHAVMEPAHTSYQNAVAPSCAASGPSPSATDTFRQDDGRRSSMATLDISRPHDYGEGTQTCSTNRFVAIESATPSSHFSPVGDAAVVFTMDIPQSSDGRSLGAGAHTTSSCRETQYQAGDLHSRSNQALRQQVRFVPEVRDLPGKVAMEHPNRPMGEAHTEDEHQSELARLDHAQRSSTNGGLRGQPKHVRKQNKLLLGRMRRSLEAVALLTCAFDSLVVDYDQVANCSLPDALDETNSSLSCFDCWPTFVDVDRDVDKWEAIFLAIEHSMGQQQLWELDASHALYGQIADLVPWELTRVAINRQPKVFRLTTEPHSHRASVLLHDDRTISIVSEDLADIVNPRRRFPKPVVIGIFLAGHAPERYPPEELHREGTRMTSRAANPDIQPAALIPGHVKQFRVSHGIMIRVPKSSQLHEEEARVVGRLHTSMGHPSEKALIRLLGQHRVRPGVLDAVRGMDCEYCKRNKGPDPPHQVSMPRLSSGSF
eukprot:6491850-Amphidinium_carterae.1